MKTCPDCKLSLPADAFWRQAKGDGLQAYCRQCMGVRNTKWRKANKEKSRAHVKAWADQNRDKISAIAKARYDADIDASRAKAMDVYRRRKPAIAAYIRQRRARDPAYRVRGRISAQLREVLSTGKGGQTTERLIGYPVSELRTHLERQFTKGMSWGNMGEWHIDHIIPISSFAITGPDDPELRRAWSLPNLRPLWAAENLAKHDRRTHLI